MPKRHDLAGVMETQGQAASDWGGAVSSLFTPPLLWSHAEGSSFVLRKDNNSRNPRNN